ncbi:MAG: nicotinate (nicotinamide) nucleotide adenylyltransferase [Clostridia bacterium]|nr:nicotinate (nicotinamide) nucleotide adenylyltransferase [Clostridia bacterium]
MRTGLYGGSFDPVHIGHLAVAKSAKEQFCLDRVIFIPTGNMPHKKGCNASNEDRVKMLTLSFDDDAFIVSDYEINRTQISYSADTIEYFKSVFPQDEIFFIIGGDSYAYIDKWYQPERIFENSTVLVYPREGEEILPPAKRLDVSPVRVSSSEIREKIKLQKNVSNLLKKEVYDYIIENNLYQ